MGTGLHPALGCPDADNRSTTTASLLSLLDAGASGAREFPEAADPEFVRNYREMEARLSAAGADGQGPKRVTPGRPAQGKKSWSSAPSVRPRSTWAAALMQVPAPGQRYARHQVARQQ